MAEEHDERADELEREADDLDEQGDRVEQHIDETRSDFEGKLSDSSVPGAQDEAGALPGGVDASAEEDEDDNTDESDRT
jgi:hypothetical protein